MAIASSKHEQIRKLLAIAMSVVRSKDRSLVEHQIPTTTQLSI
jgi:hypothetical protein